MITIQIEEKDYMVEKGTSIQSLVEQFSQKETIYAGFFNGKLHALPYLLKESGTLELLKADSEIGKQIYERSLHFLFITAVKLLWPQANIFVEHALSGGVYCDIQHINLGESEVEVIRHKMMELIANKEVIERIVVSTKDAITYFESRSLYNKANLLRERSSKTSSIYTLCGIDDYFYGIMLPNVSYLQHFALRSYGKGVWISASNNFRNQAKLFHVFQEFEQWGNLIKVSNVAQLNDRIKEDKMDEMVLMSETMVENQLMRIASTIVKEHPTTKFIMIAGPSSAGKTTFSRRLAIHLKIAGKEPFAISMDDFYKNREDCPRLADGSYDFETLESLDLEVFNDSMFKLLNKQPVVLPIFNFKSGLREWQDKETILKEDQILIIEGIHGLNPECGKNLPDDAKFKIYMNALTHLNLDEHNRIATSDYRLIRRIARDYQFRGWSAKDTIHFWKNVKEGEDKYIYPYQEEADYIFNSSMIYELAILKDIVIPLLENVKQSDQEYLEAIRLKKLLAYFKTGKKDAVPRHSIFAEFIGNSIFKDV